VLDKKNLPIGARVKVVSLKNKTAGIFIGDANDVMPSIRVQTAFPSIKYDPNHKDEYLLIGDIVSIVKPPRKVGGINVCRVKVESGREGEVFWTELRGNCELISVPTDTQESKEKK
jgi:hypothetical protein